MVEHQAGQRPDEAVALGQRQKQIGPERAASWVVPPDQRLGRDNSAVKEVDDRLDLDVDLAACDGVAQLAHQGQQRGIVHVDIGPVEHS